MLTQVLGLIVDIGLGAMAYRLGTQLRAVVSVMEKMLEDHEKRIISLEGK